MSTLECVLRRAAVSLAFVTVAGCAPTINQFTVGEGEPGERLPVSASITPNQTTIQGVELDTRAVGGTFTDAGALAGSGGSYSGQTPRLGPGDYEAQLTVRYLRLMLPGEQTKTAVQPFSLSWPDGTFAFENGLQGWTYQGVAGTSDEFQPCEQDTITAFPHFSHTPAGWPTGIGDTNPGYPSGAVRAIVSSVCYPDQPGEVSNTFWQFNLVSPDLSNNPDWQGISGVSFRMIASLPVQVMATVVYAQEDGSDGYASPFAGNVLDFADIPASQQWVVVSKNGYVPDRPVRRILIRVFGRPQSVAVLGEAATVLLDVVSPIRQ